MMTYTYVLLGISQAAFDEIAAKLRDAGYHHAFTSMKEDVIDMHGIALLKEERQ